ncbi:hypothetical protein GYMLUDRAFT_242461 [Collybiopsis luxurians FD-317 M1]|uniref:DUF6533 domain-containing protein n=1 Tax=Collybiopsis luxurians FD-317 M1 TaxID=944289 RepID=A0A0D0CJ85_9AGAR|nr:hypothetical protein GYMLUDRAFT_242461 [Collybiopsis luxurians FD-317 M1]
MSLADVQTQVNWEHYVELIAFVYDWIITFGQEVSRFWKRDLKRLPAILFFINRYLTLLGYIAIIALNFWNGPVFRGNQQLGRRNLNLYGQVLIFVVQLNINVLFILRVTALYGGSRRIKLFLGVVVVGMISNIIVQLYLIDSQPFAAVDSPTVSQQVGNVRIFTPYQGRHFAYLWIGMFMFDFCIFSLTLWKTLRTLRDGQVSGGIVTIVMRDGLMYFAIITLSTLANILVFAFAPDLVKGLLPTFSNMLSSVLMSRLMLNLRGDYIDPTIYLTQLSGIAFAQVNTQAIELQVQQHSFSSMSTSG